MTMIHSDTLPATWQEFVQSDGYGSLDAASCEVVRAIAGIVDAKACLGDRDPAIVPLDVAVDVLRSVLFALDERMAYLCVDHPHEVAQ